MKDFKTKNGFFTGNVGIGTTNPSGKLDVSNGDIMISDQTHGATRKIYFDQKNSGGGSTDFSISSTNGSIDFRSEAQGKSYLYLQSGGNVGIGTTNPTSFTGFMGGNAIATTINANDGAVLNLQRGTDINNSGIGALQFVNTNNSADAGMGSGSQLLGLISIANVTSNGNTGSDAGGNLRLYTKQEAGSCLERMRITSDGNVGIGTTNPRGRLDIIGKQPYAQSASNLEESVSKSALAVQGASDAGSGLFAGVETSDAKVYLQGSNGNGSAAVDLLLQPFSGNVGIGTTNPGEILVIQDSSNPRLQIRDGDSGSATARTAGTLHLGESTTLGVAIENYTHNFNDNCSMVFKTTAASGTITERMRISPAGNVGIGTASPTNALNVIRSSTSGVPVAWLHNSNNTTTGNQGVTVSCINNNSSIKVFTVRSNNSTHTNGTALMEVNGQGGVYLSSLAASSDVVTNSSKQLTTSSDKRLKNDLGDCEYGLSEIMQVQPKKYTWKEGPKDQQPTIGFFAQDVHPIMPEAAPREAFKNEKDEDDYKWGLNSQTIIAALVNATKEQQQIIDDLKSQNESLAARISALES